MDEHNRDGARWTRIGGVTLHDTVELAIATKGNSLIDVRMFTRSNDGADRWYGSARGFGLSPRQAEDLARHLLAAAASLRPEGR